MEPVNKRAVLLEFIETYRTLPILWDTNHKDYYNRERKGKAYDILIDVLKKIECDVSRETVVKKINSLRSNFRKELRKIEESKQSAVTPDDIYQPSLWYYSEFLFLTEHETSEETRPTSSISECYIKAEMEDFIPEVYNGSPSNENVPIENNALPPAPKNKRKRISTHDMSTNTVVNPINQTVDKEDDEEFLVMAKSYAYKLKKMDPLQRLFADKLINDVLFEGQLQNLTRNSSINLNNFSENQSFITPSNINFEQT